MDQLRDHFERNAIGDLCFGERYVDKRLFNVFYAEALFLRHDADNDGLLTHAECQAALKFLTRPPKDGGPKPDVPFACPPEAYDAATGEARIPKKWFASLYRTMP